MSAAVIATPAAAAILRGALAELRRPLNRDGNGWAQGQFGRGNQCKCAIGALDAAHDSIIERGGDCSVEAYRAACRALRIASGVEDLAGLDGSVVIYWNDRRGRTFSEVEAVFERAIELTEAGA